VWSNRASLGVRDGRLRRLLLASAFVACLHAVPVRAGEVTQEDIDALERDLGNMGDCEARDNLLAMLMEGLAERCFPRDSRLANPQVQDDWSRQCLGRAAEVADEILARPEHRDHARALFIAGKASIALRRPQAGEDYLRRFLAEYPADPETPLVHYTLAEKAWSDRIYDVAATHYAAALDGLTTAEAAGLRYRLSWSLHNSGRVDEAAATLADLLSAEEDVPAEARATARRDLSAMLVEIADPDATVTLATTALGADAPDLAEAVAGELMTASSHASAGHCFGAMVAAWPEHERAASWQVGRVDADMARLDTSAALESVSTLMRGYGPETDHGRAAGDGAEAQRQALRVEEASRSAVGLLHQQRRDGGAPSAEALETLYRVYLESFPRTSKGPEMRLALAALLQEEARLLDAIDEMLGVVERQGGREIGAQAARLAAELIARGVAGGEEATAFEDRVLVLARSFTSGYPRHGDGVGYSLQAGRVLLGREQYEDARAVLMGAATRLPASADASACVALALETPLQAEDWAGAASLAEEVLGSDRLVTAHPQLGAVARKTRATARFNQALLRWEAGDPTGAAPLFEQVATDDPQGDTAPGALLNAASCLAEAGDAGRAPMLLRRVYTRYPHSEFAAPAMEQEAYLRWEEEDFVGAAGIYRRLADTFSDDARASFALYTSAALYDQEGRFDEAVDGYRTLVHRHPAAPETAEARPRLVELEEGE
jgi:TolA-binding protein